MRLPDGSTEPLIADWAPLDPASLLGSLGVVDRGRPMVLAVDGRSGAGKSTLARLLANAVPGACCVATDDIAWNHSMFDWASELASGIIAPVRRGLPVDYRPPGWIAHDRPGAVTVPAARTLLVVEGVGSSQRALAGAIDAAVWVQSDAVVARRLGIARDIASGVNGDPDAAIAFWDEWAAAEEKFLERDEPWLRTSVFLAGVPRAAGGLQGSSPPPR